MNREERKAELRRRLAIMDKPELEQKLLKAARLKLRQLIEDANAWRRARDFLCRAQADPGDFELDEDVDGGEEGQYWVTAAVYVHEKETK